MSAATWFDKLSPREQVKQRNRWRYYRQYYRRKWGAHWEWALLWDLHRA